MCVEYLYNLVFYLKDDYSIMNKFHAIVINICVIKKLSLCDKPTLPKTILFTLKALKNDICVVDI